jgi:transposase InsO family protein
MEQVRRFLDGTADVEFLIDTKQKRYEWIEETLIRFRYLERCKREKGLLLKFLGKVSGYSYAQVKRFVRQYFETGHVRPRKAKKRGFIRKYTDADIYLLAETDELHGTLSGPATKKLCERACTLFDEGRYERLAGISVAHLYNLRRSGPYRRIRIHFTKTRSTPVAIGERRRPQPDGRPGHIRVDTVHQGDLDGNKGVYYINAVDEVTQFEIVCAVEKISENFLIPVLELLLEQFPFVIRGFHSDNGSEFINRNVAALLNKLLIELTKSRPRHSNDNALAESKNGSIVRKHLGYSHIPQRHAPLINRFLIEHLNPYVNFHRPCFFPETVTDHRGKQVKRYPYHAMMTPYDKLRSLPNAQRFIKPTVSFHLLDEFAAQLSDNESAKQMNSAKIKLFNTIHEHKSKPLIQSMP